MKRSPQWKSSFFKGSIYQRTNSGCYIKEKLLQVDFFFFVCVVLFFLAFEYAYTYFWAYKPIIDDCFIVLLSTDEHRLSDYSIGPEAKLNLVIRPSGEKTGASGAGPSSRTQGRVWQIASTILAKHFSPADASKVHENLLKVFKYILLNNIHTSVHHLEPIPANLGQFTRSSQGHHTETSNYTHSQ